MNLAPRGSRHGLHAAVFKEGRLEDSLLHLPVVAVGRTGRACPHLGDISVAALHRGQRCLGRDYLPLAVVEQRMCGHIATHVQPPLPPILLGIGESLIQRTIVEVILELVREIRVLGRLVLRTPREAVIFLPFALERLAVSASCPELGLLQEDGVDACIDDGTYMSLLEVFEIVLRRHDVGHPCAVPDGVARHRLLSLVHVLAPIPATCEVILILAPGDARHEVGGVATFSPRVHSLAECQSGPVVGAIHHHCIGPVIQGGTPGTAALEGGLGPLWRGSRARYRQ